MSPVGGGQHERTGSGEHKREIAVAGDDGAEDKDICDHGQIRSHIRKPNLTLG
jgi:hypothetical protein